MKHKATRFSKSMRPGAPLSIRDMILREALLDDEYFHRNAPALPLPVKPETHVALDLTPAAAVGMGWDIFRKGIRTMLP